MAIEQCKRIELRDSMDIWQLNICKGDIIEKESFLLSGFEDTSSLYREK